MKETDDILKAAPEKAGFLVNRNFALFLIGRMVSLIGDRVFDLTLIVWIATIIARRSDGSFESWAPAAVSGVLVAASVPTVVFAPVAGVFSDRWDKRHTMLVTDALRAILVASLLLVSGIIPLPFFAGGRPPQIVQLSAIYSVVFLSSICSQFFSPSRLSLIGDIVPDASRERASALQQGSYAMAQVLGPPLAAPLLITLGVQWALIINALSFLVSFATIYAMRIPSAARSVVPGEQGHFWQELREGINFAFNHPVIRTVMILLIIATLGTGAVDALIAFFTAQNLHVEVKAVGYLAGSLGAGTIVGAFMMSIFDKWLRAERLLSLGAIAAGIVFLLFSRTTSLLSAVILAFLVGFFLAATNVSAGPLILRSTPRSMLGPVNSIMDPMQMLASLVAVALSGYLVSTILQNFQQNILGITFGPIDTIFAVSALLIALGGVYAALNLRSARKEVLQQPLSNAK